MVVKNPNNQGAKPAPISPEAAKKAKRLIPCLGIFSEVVVKVPGQRMLVNKPHKMQLIIDIHFEDENPIIK